MEFKNPLGAVEPGSSVVLASLAVDGTVSVPAGGSETISFTPPAGFFYRLIAMRLVAPGIAAATSGNHDFLIGQAGYALVYGRSAYNAGIEWNFSYWFAAGLSQRPPNPGDQLAALILARGTDATPIEVRYGQGADAAQPGTRTYRLFIEQVKE